MATHGLKISKAGNDVKTALDKDLIFHSDLNSLKVKKVGVTSVNVAHGLAYTPIFFTMNEISATKYGVVGQNYANGLPSCDATNFKPSAKSKYYIFYQEGAG